MATLFTGLSSGSAPTMKYDLYATETGRTANSVTYSVTVNAYLSRQVYDYFNATVTPTIYMGNASVSFGALGTFPVGAGTKTSTKSITVTNVTAGSTSVAWAFSATQSLGGTSSSSTGYVGSYGNGSTTGCSVFATTPTQPEGWSFWDGNTWGVNEITTYYRENIGISNALICWNSATGTNGTPGYQLEYTTGSDAWTSISLGNQTSYTINFLGGKSDIRFRVKASNTVGSTTLWSGYVYSSTYYRNVMTAPAVTSSDSVTYTPSTLSIAIGAATDNLGSTVKYTIKGRNFTEITNSAGQASNNSNKWIGKRYSKTLATSNTIPTLADISGLSPADVRLIAGTSTDLVTAAGWNGYDYFIGHFSTNVYVTSAKTISVTMNSDDTSRFYLNGTSIGTVTTYNAVTTFNVPLIAGWNKIEVLVYEGGGGESLTLTALQSLVEQMYSELSAANTSATTVTINTNNGATGIYIPIDDLKTAALAGIPPSSTSMYKSNLEFQVIASNAYGSAKIVNINIPIDLGIDAPINMTVPAPTFNSNSYFTINAVNYYFPEHKYITLNIASAVTDALGRNCSFDVRFKEGTVDTLIKNTGVKSGASSATVDDSELGLSTLSKTVSFYIKAKTLNGVLKASAATVSIGVHHYAKPTISYIGLTRTAAASTFDVTVKRNTSLAMALANTITITSPWTQANPVGATTNTHTFTATSGTLLETDSPVITLTALDPIGAVIDSTAMKTTYTVTIPKFNPIFSVREKGVGVNMVPTGKAKLEVNGNIAVFGKEFVDETTTTLPATADWYRIATSNVNIGNCSAEFEIMGAVSGHHSNTKIYASMNYGIGIDLKQLGHSIYDATGTINRVRLVYHTTYSGNYAYLEVYMPIASAVVLTVRKIGGNGWTLLDPIVVGSIPTGYTSSILDLWEKGIATYGGDISTGAGAFVSSRSYADPDTNVDHIWHDESTNTWNFVSDGAYKGAGNSTIKSGLLRLGNGGDVTLTSTAHPFQMGSDAGMNIAMDVNEIQARNNGAIADLNINALGGNVNFGANVSTNNWYVYGESGATAYGNGAWGIYYGTISSQDTITKDDWKYVIPYTGVYNVAAQFYFDPIETGREIYLNVYIYNSSGSLFKQMRIDSRTTNGSYYQFLSGSYYWKFAAGDRLGLVASSNRGSATTGWSNMGIYYMG